jgi:hypothetical protein
MEDPRAAEGVRFAARVASDPYCAVRRWKVLSGRKAVGCPSAFPVPEIFHCVGLLPVLARNGEELRSLAPLIDAWVMESSMPRAAAMEKGKDVYVLRDPVPPPDLAGMLDQVESLSEWAETLSGEACTEGALWKSLRTFRERDALTLELTRRCAAFAGILGPGMFRDLLSAGRFLPAETHAILMKRILGEFIPEGKPEEEEGDPFLFLARRASARRTVPWDAD